ncbi:MAG TPA: MFS transporter [Paucimonas sp.]|nr:MFS transporter [Paucimonas sp.]
MNNKRIILGLFLTYFVFAILLNSVGTVILQVINNYDVSKSSASILEAIKDLSIAAVSFFVASLLPRLGFKNAMLTGLAIVTAGCVMMPLVPSFATTELLFLCIGVAFALVKVSVYSSVGLVTDDPRHHASLLNSIEGFFMVGVLSGSWVFGFFIDSSDPRSPSWLQTYWVLAALCLVVFLLLLSTPFDEGPAAARGTVKDDFSAMLKLVVKPLVCVYVISAFLFVLIEQGIGTWLPTFNNEILKLPTAMSVQVTSIFAASAALGRLGAGVIMRRVHWYPVVNCCVLGVGLLVVVSLPLADNVVANPYVSWSNAPIAAYIFPLLGLFLAPIYPAINSVMLSSLPKQQHAAMTGLLVIFSALGGSTGSRITAVVFEKFDGQFAFYLSLVPLAIVLVTLYFFKRGVDGRPAGMPAQAAAG